MPALTPVAPWRDVQSSCSLLWLSRQAAGTQGALPPGGPPHPPTSLPATRLETEHRVNSSLNCVTAEACRLQT